MRNRYVWSMLAIAISVLVMAQTLNSILSIASFEKIFKESLVATFEIIGSDLKRKVETAVNFGKPIEKFRGIKFILKAYMKKEENLTGISITDANGLVLYSTNKDEIKKPLVLAPPPVFKNSPNVAANEHYSSHATLHGDLYYVSLPIYYENQKWIGSVHVQFHKSIIIDQIRFMIKKSAIYLIPISGIATFLLFGLIFWESWRYQKKDRAKPLRISPKTKNYIFIGTILTLSLVSYSYLNNTYFKQTYLKMANVHMATLSNLVKGEIDRILRMGVPINRLKKMDILLSSIVRNAPQCSEIIILDENRREQYRASALRVASVFDPEFQARTIPFEEGEHSRPLESKKKVAGYALFVVNKELIDEQTYNLSIDSLTIIVVSVLFGFEVLFFSYIFTIRTRDLELLKDRFLTSGVAQKTLAQKKRAKYTILRSTAFIFFLSELIPLAFFPLFVKQVYENNPVVFLGLSKQMMLSLPISAYMFGVTLFVLWAGRLLERITVLRSMSIFGVLLFAGSLLSAFSHDLLQLILFRFISGAGYGGIVASGITLIIRNTDQEDRTSGFGYWLNGSATATICAVPVGSVIAYYLGYRVAMIFAALSAAFFVLFLHLLVRLFHFRWMFQGLETASDTDATQKEGIAGTPSPVTDLRQNRKSDIYLGVFKDRNVFSALFFATIPVQIAFIGFLHFAFPLYLDSVGISQSNIGRFITCYGLAYIVVNPFISRWSDKSGNERIFMILGNLIVGLVLILFTFAKNASMLVLVITFVGTGCAFVTATTGSYITLTRQARRTGASQLSSLFKTFEKLGTVAGPLLIGVLIGVYGYIDTMTIIGVMILLTLVAFIVFSKRLRD